MTGRGTKTSPETGRLLLLMMALVPVIVIVAVGIALLLVRAGTGYVVGIGVPFVLAMGGILFLGVFLGRAATKNGHETTGESGNDEAEDRSDS